MGGLRSRGAGAGQREAHTGHREHRAQARGRAEPKQAGDGAGTAAVGASGRGQQPRARPQPREEEEGWDTPAVKGGAGHASGRPGSKGKASPGLSGGPLAPPQTFSQCFPVSPGLRQEPGCLGGRSISRRGASFAESQVSDCAGQEAASWSLGGSRGARSPGVAAKPKVRSPFPRRTPPEGRREQHMEKRQQLPRRRCKRGRRPSTVCCPSPGPVPFPLVPSRDGNWGLCGLALCGLQQWAPGPSGRVSKQGEAGTGGGGRTRSCTGSACGDPGGLPGGSGS